MEATVREAGTPILAIDLGTTTGWAFMPAAGVIISGTWDLHPRKDETEGERYRRFTESLTQFYRNEYIGSAAWLETPGLEIFYEDVRRHLGTRAAHVYGGMLATLKMWCLEKQLREPVGVGVGQIKKFWARKGNATKKDMMDEAVARGFDPVDDNEADALALLHMRIAEGPDIGTKPKRRKTKATPTKQARRRLARRAAIRLREGDRRLPEEVCG